MNENFKKFKKKVWIDVLIKCIIIGLAAGFVAVNAVLLPCKLYGVNLLWPYYVLIAIGGTALGGGIAFLILRTNDKSIAKRLDSELELEERVQTAYEYNGVNSEILELQRENAEETLKKFPARSLPFKNIAATAVCAAVLLCGVAAVPVVSYTVPAVFANSNDRPPVDPERPVSDWEWAALDDLIRYVYSSKKADDEAKNGMGSELEGLRSVLKSGITQSSLALFVRNTVTNLNNKVKDANDKYPNVSEDELHPQAIANNEEAEYVINKLYEIFNLQRTDGGENNGGGNGDSEDDENGNGSGDNRGDGALNVNDMPFFDPEEGYVLAGYARDKYYLIVQKALEEGAISSEEWETILVKYFADLSANDND